MSAKKKAQSFPRTDCGNAEAFAKLYGDSVRFDHSQGRWLIWDQDHRRWERDKASKVRQFAKRVARLRATSAVNIADRDESGREFKWAKRSESRYGIDAALEMAKSEPSISDDGAGWDADPWLLGVANGIVDLRTGKLREATQQDRLTKFSPVAFDPLAQCPRFEKFIQEIFAGDGASSEYIQRAIGYSLTGLVGEQCLFLLYGTGANGKSTLLNVLRHIEGDYAIDLLPSAVEQQSRGGVLSPELLKLHGSRLATVIEKTRRGVWFNEERLKRLTGDDPVTCRPLYKEPVTFNPTHKLWMAFNDKPDVEDDSHGFWRRMRIIPFTQQFKLNEELPRTLKGEEPGILAWAVRGCLAWQKEGLGMPKAVEDATREYEAESDPLAPFLQDCCAPDPAESVSSAELWNAYLEWARCNGERPLKRKEFGERLSKRGFTPDKDGHDNQRVRRGLALLVKVGG